MSQAFHLEKLPDNVRLSKRLERMRLSRWGLAAGARLSRWAFGCAFIKSEGRFAYHRAGTTTEIKFNGRNAQYHALYDYNCGYELETSILLERLARGAGVFYDVGANWGYFSLLIAAVPEFSGPIYAFEPNPAVFQDLVNCITQAGLKGRVTPLNNGVGRVKGELRLELADSYKSGLGCLRENGTGIVVPVQSLDGFDLPWPTIIKIDAEGMETAILEGSAQLLREHRPFIVFESFLNFREPESTRSSLRLLRAAGYRVFNPTLAFGDPTEPLPTSYGDSLDELLGDNSYPPTMLFPVDEVTRFLMRPQLNLFACHSERIAELVSLGFLFREPR
jgi:FkbM family methyltransferase